MECRTLEINIKRAKGLKNVNLFKTMDVYAVVSISSGDPRKKQEETTPVDKEGGTDPHWNYPMTFKIDEATAKSNRLINLLDLKITLVCQRMNLGDKKIGKVIVPIKQLLDEYKGTSERTVSYSLRTMSGKEKGTIEFSYKYTVKIQPPRPPARRHEPGTDAFPPPPQGYGYRPPPLAGHEYGGFMLPLQPGLVYAPVHQPQRPQQKVGFGGMAWGAGAGLPGGLLISDGIADVGDVATCLDLSGRHGV